MVHIGALLLLVTACTCGNSQHDSPPLDTPSRDSEPVDHGPCVDPQPILAVDGASTGYERCADGSVNRVEDGVALGGNYTGEIDACEDWVLHRSCDSDDDCQDPPGGHCAYSPSSYDPPPCCECIWPCASDDDCDPTEICLPPEVHELPLLSWPRCVTARCHTGESCGSGECAVATQADCGWGKAELRCRTESDECRSNSDCEDECGFCWAYDGYMKCVGYACN